MLLGTSLLAMPALTLSSALSVARAEVPSLVTLSQGEVVLVAASGESPAPPAPFALKAGEHLRLSEGASVVVLHKGLARRVIGPGQADPAAFSSGQPGAVDAEVGALLSRQASVARAGASRAEVAELVLQRPLPEDELSRLPEIRWTCPTEAGGCPEITVSVAAFSGGGTPLWEGEGAGRVEPGLTELPAGPLVLTVGDRRFVVEGAKATRKAELERIEGYARAASSELDAADQAASIAGLVWPLGFETEALWQVDAALRASPDHVGLQALGARLEELAGVASSP